MIFKSIDRLAVCKKKFHIALENELLEVDSIEGHENDKVSMIYIENSTLHIVSKDFQYVADYISYKNIESWGKNHERDNTRRNGRTKNH